MSLRHLVFDCDGVLWQGTNEGYFLCYHRAAIESGIDLEFEVARTRILENWGQSARREIEGMLPEHPDRIDEVLERYRNLVRSDLFLGGARLVPGAAGTLRALVETFNLSAITGMNSANLGKLLERFGINRFFLHAVSTAETDDPDRQKHTGYHLGQMMQQENLRSNEVLCVGDALPDIQMARSRGVSIVIVLTGHLSEQEARSLGVECVLPSICDLPDYLRARSAKFG